MADAARAAVERFVNRFVIPAKRERFLAMLLHKDREKRINAIQQVYKWVEAKLLVELVGEPGRRLIARFEEMPGILLDENSAEPMTIAEASAGSPGFGALFIADAEPVALLIPEFGPPTLCSNR